MILKPMVRNNICINAHPLGCELETRRQIDFIRSRREVYARFKGPAAVLVVGCSTGYGLASRVAAAFGFGAATLGVSFEKAPTATRTGTPGWYNNRAFDSNAARAGIASATIGGDAYSRAVKAEVVEAARRLGLRFDFVVYSLASPARVDPDTGTLYRSVIKPIGGVYRGRTVDVFTRELSWATVESATEDEVGQTVKVMGGEDWALWIAELERADLLAPRASTIAYSYVGPSLSWPIYRDGTIGRAKAHLEATARRLSSEAAGELRAWVSINKALVTRASAVIPVIPLYVSTLFKVMKERGIHEDCIGQIDRLYRERLFGTGGVRSEVPVDTENRIRIDDLEMDAAVQAEVESRMSRMSPENLDRLADLEGFRADFLRAHGFSVEGVDYGAEVSPS